MKTLNNSKTLKKIVNKPIDLKDLSDCRPDILIQIPIINIDYKQYGTINNNRAIRILKDAITKLENYKGEK